MQGPKNQGTREIGKRELGMKKAGVDKPGMKKQGTEKAGINKERINKAGTDKAVINKQETNKPDLNQQSRGKAGSKMAFENKEPRKKETNKKEFRNRVTGNIKTNNKEFGSKESGNIKTNNKEFGSRESGNIKTNKKEFGTKESGNIKTNNKEFGFKESGNTKTNNKEFGSKGTGNRNINKKEFGIKEPRNKKTNEKDFDSNKIKNRKDNLTENNQKICPANKSCGGCKKMYLNYPQQLKEKQEFVEKLMNKYCKVDPIIGMKNPYHYRNKVHAVFDRDRRGNIISGVYEPGTHKVVLVEKCLIEDKRADAIINSIRGMLKSFKIKTYDEDTGYGLFRHVLIRTGFTSGEIMVILVLGSPILPSKNNFVKALLKLHPEITTIILNINDKRTSMVLGDKQQVLYGKGYIEDTLCQKVFRISPKSFYQVNSVQTEVLYSKAIELAKFTGNETIIDAYCGIGTIGIIASDLVKRVISVELNQDAVRDANTNAKLNQIKNVEIYNQDAGEFMTQLAANNESADVVFLDPPRAGSDEKFLSSLCRLNPKKVVYISCNPVTLERDTSYLTKNGYKVEKVVPVDMFPGTEHVETVVLMSRKDNK